VGCWVIICVTAWSCAGSPALTQEPPKEQKQGDQASPQGPKTSPKSTANLPAYFTGTNTSRPSSVRWAMQLLPRTRCCRGRRRPGPHRLSVGRAKIYMEKKLAPSCATGGWTRACRRLRPPMSSSLRLSRSSMIAKQSKGRQATHRRRHRSPDGERRSGHAIFQRRRRVRQCHSPSGDLAGIAGKLQGLELLRRMLYPEERRSTVPAGLTGQVPTATRDASLRPNRNRKLAYRDEFTISLVDALGWYRSCLPVR